MSEARKVRISFAAAMVNALIAGDKTETRRFAFGVDRHDQPKEALWFSLANGTDLLVREPTFREPELVDQVTGTRLIERICYRADGEDSAGPAYRFRHGETWAPDAILRRVMDLPVGLIPWGRPRYMPAWATRLVLTLTDVRRERLNDLTDEAAMAEGATKRAAGWCMDWSGIGRYSRKHDRPLTEADIAMPTPRAAFFAYWTYLHTPKGVANAKKPPSNPELAVVRFSVRRLPHPCWDARA